MNGAAPAVTVVGFTLINTGTGLFTVNARAALSPPPGAALKTVTCDVPAVAMRAALTVAVSCVFDTRVVASAAAFHRTTAPGMKSLPAIVSMNSAAPAFIVVGFTLVTTGSGLFTVSCA